MFIVLAPGVYSLYESLETDVRVNENLKLQKWGTEIYARLEPLFTRADHLTAMPLGNGHQEYRNIVSPQCHVMHRTCITENIRRMTENTSHMTEDKHSTTNMITRRPVINCSRTITDNPGHAAEEGK